jgi:hypothetical protein
VSGPLPIRVWTTAATHGAARESSSDATAWSSGGVARRDAGGG